MDANEQLVEFAARGNVDGVRLAMQQGADVNFRSGLGGSTAAMRAAMGKRLDALQLLVTSPHWDGAVVDDHGRTALHVAAYLGNAAVVQAVLQRVVACCPRVLTAGDEHGNTPLHCVSNSFETVRESLLIDKARLLLAVQDTNASARNDAGRTAAQCARRLHRVDLASAIDNAVIAQRRRRWDSGRGAWIAAVVATAAALSPSASPVRSSGRGTVSVGDPFAVDCAAVEPDDASDDDDNDNDDYDGSDGSDGDPSTSDGKETDRRSRRSGDDGGGGKLMRRA